MCDSTQFGSVINSRQFMPLLPDIESGDVGLAILSTVGFVRSCQYGMRVSAEFETQLTSIERIVEYINLPSEPPLDDEGDKPALPSLRQRKGSIVFNNLSLRYSEDSDFVLTNFSLDVRPAVSKPIEVFKV